MFNRAKEIDKLFKLQKTIEDIVRYSKEYVDFKIFFEEYNNDIAEVFNSKLTNTFLNHIYIFDLPEITGVDMINNYLNENSSNLSDEEKVDILNLNKSYQSIFLIKSVDVEKGVIVVEDQILHMEKTVLMEETEIGYFSEGEYLYTRIVSSGDTNFFIAPSITISKVEALQLISMITRDAKIVETEMVRKGFVGNQEKGYNYLKLFSFKTSLYVLSTMDFIGDGEELEIEYDFPDQLYDKPEIKGIYMGMYDDYMDFLYANVDDANSVRLLLEQFLFENSGSEDPSLMYFQEADIYQLFVKACENGVFVADYLLEDTILALELYFEYMDEYGYDFTSALTGIESVRENIFSLKNILHRQSLKLVNEDLADRLMKTIDETQSVMLDQFLQYFLAVINIEYKVTPTKRLTTADTIRALLNVMINYKLGKSEAISQSEYPVIDYMYSMVMANEFAHIDGDNLFPTHRGLRFYSLDLEEIAAFLLMDILNEMTIASYLKVEVEEAVGVRNILKATLIKMNEQAKVNLLDEFETEDLKAYIMVLAFSGVIQFTDDAEGIYELTKLGKIFVKKLIDMDNVPRALAMVRA